MSAVAVCGLAPGAGTTTLARLLAPVARNLGAEAVDCGLLGGAAAPAALARASHVVWALPVGPDAGATATALLLEGELAPPPGAARELLTVVATQRRLELPRRALQALREVVALRAERLVLVPYARALAGGRTSPSAPPAALSLPLAAIGGVLRWPPPR